MRRVKEDFDKRKTELNAYFDFLLKLDKDQPILHYSETGIQFTHTIDAELLKILKANGFLLIYNLVESFCRNFIVELLTVIQGKRLTLRKLSIEARKIWIAQKVRDFKDPLTGNQKLETCFHEVATDILNNTVIEFGAVIHRIENDERYDAFQLSGSIDKRKIQDLARMYGFNHITSPEGERAGADLEQIKIFRNKLAHGRITFAECGRDKTVSDMINYKDNAIAYLEDVLLNIKVYIRDKKFRQ